MATRILAMFAIMTMELGAGIALILVTVSEYTYPSHYYNPRAEMECAAICVGIGAAVVVAWLLTLALFLRKSARASASRMVEEARAEAGRILSEATERALALSSVDGGRCRFCGNPRTGQFCPKCGKAAGGMS